MLKTYLLLSGATPAPADAAYTTPAAQLNQNRREPMSDSKRTQIDNNKPAKWVEREIERVVAQYSGLRLEREREMWNEIGWDGEVDLGYDGAERLIWAVNIPSLLVSEQPISLEACEMCVACEVGVTCERDRCGVCLCFFGVFSKINLDHVFKIKSILTIG